MAKITVSVIKADVGGWCGHSNMHPDLIEIADEMLEEAKEKGIIKDYFVAWCGDDLDLIMTHTKGVNNPEIHKLAWDVFNKCTERAKELKLYGAGQDLLVDTFSGNVKGMGPGVAEMEFEERKSEPIIVFVADKTAPSAWNLPLYKMFADPFNTSGLVIDPSMRPGFTFEILDVKENKMIKLNAPEDLYDILLLIGASSRFIVKRVYRRKDNEIAAVASVEKVNKIAGHYVGKDDPVLIVRCQSGFPAVGEALEPFTYSHLVEGWMRGSHYGPIMPVPLEQATPSRFDGPPRVVALGFQIANGELIGPVDFFEDVAFDRVRQKCNEIADYIRRHGPFEPHRLPLEEMEYTTLPQVLERLKDKWIKVEE